MGCNCGKNKISSPQRRPTSYKPFISSSKQANIKIIPKKPLVTFNEIFKTIKDPIDIINFNKNDIVVYFVGKEGNAESSYLKNLFPKILSEIKDYNKLTYINIDVDLAKGMNNILPATTIIIIKGKLFKSFKGIFDIKNIILKLIAIP